MTVWNRLEGRPRTQAFDRALRAEVRDALWMLSRQWQLDEFRGDDAGSPFFAKLHVTHAPLTRYRPGDGPAEPFATDGPLEAKVERRPLPLVLGGREVALDLRLVMGRQWLRLIDGIGDLSQAFTDTYAIPLPDPASPVDADRVAHPEVWQAIAAVAGRRMDGGRLYLHLRSDPAHKAYDGVAGRRRDRQGRARQAGGALRALVRAAAAPAAGGRGRRRGRRSAWSTASPASARRTATARRCSPPTSTPAGRWTGTASTSIATPTALGADADPPPARDDADAHPGAAGVRGDAQHALVGVRGPQDELRRHRRRDTTDLAKLLFVEFGLVYANDWFLVPLHRCPTGPLADRPRRGGDQRVRRADWIEPAGTGADDDWQRWSMFTLSVAGSGPQAAERSLLLPPTVAEGAGGRAARGGRCSSATRWRTWCGASSA